MTALTQTAGNVNQSTAELLFMEVVTRIADKHQRNRYSPAYNAEVNKFMDAVQACDNAADCALVAMSWLIREGHSETSSNVV
jgi:hypothetical protein